MNQDKLQQLQIAPEAKHRSGGSLWAIFLVVGVVTGVAIFLAWPRESDQTRVFDGESKKTITGPASADKKPAASATAASGSTTGGNASSSARSAPSTGRNDDAILTVSGYIVSRERIELSPRFMGVVKWIGVKKGDAVTNGQVIALLDDAEYQARLKEGTGRLVNARVAIEKAELDYKRTLELVKSRVEMQKVEDDARLQLASARASLQELEGSQELLRTYVDWCVIKSPIDGVVLEKLVDPNELVSPQTFGGTRGPSTSLIAMADLNDLQIEIDLNESDLPKVFLNQKCKISPEAYLDRFYEGYVAEMAPEANRQKGTLQIKVKVLSPDRYLTPELSAKVDFIERPPARK